MPRKINAVASRVARRTALLAAGATVLAGAAWVFTGAAWVFTGAANAAQPAVKVWKSPACGCCGGWISHLRGAGFAVNVYDIDDVQPVKLRHGVPQELQSCHTAVVGAYVVEGHVPAGDIKRLLEERPAAKGLAVAGMPQSAPGMDGPAEPYDVVLFGGPRGSVHYASH